MSPVDVTDNELTLPTNFRIWLIHFLCLGLAMCTQVCPDTGAQMATVYVFSCFMSYVSMSTEERCVEVCQRSGTGKIFRLPYVETSTGGPCKEDSWLDS